MTERRDPRVVRTRAAVLAATCDALVEDGYAGVTIDGVARRCGVARTTIYRHWASVPELVIDAVQSLKPPIDAPDTGSVRGDALALLRGLRDALRGSRWGGLLPVLVDTAFREPRVHDRQRAFVHARRGTMRTVLQRGMERGQLSPDTDLDLLAERLGAPLFYRHLVSHDPISDAYLSRLVDSVLPGRERLPPGAERAAASWG